MKVAEENLAHTKTIHEKVISQVSGMPKDDGSLQKKKDDLAKEVEQTKRALATQVGHVICIFQKESIWKKNCR